MKTVMFKLVSGDVVLGKGDLGNLGDLSKEITIEKPMQLMLDPTQGGIGMMPFEALYVQKELESHTFRTIDIMYELEVHESFEEAYVRQTTGIETGLPEIELGAE